MCWRQRALQRHHTGNFHLSYAQALEAGWVQLTFANTRPQERRAGPRVVPPLARAAVGPAAHRQLILFDAPPRDLAAGLHGHFPPPPDPRAADQLCGMLTAWATTHSWTARQAIKARQGLRILLALQDTPGAPIPASLIYQLGSIDLPTRALHDFLAAHHLADDDRTPAVDAWFTRTTAHLPRPMTDQLRHWLTIRLHGHHQHPRTQARSQNTARHNLHFALPVLTRIAAAGTHDLADVNAPQLAQHLAAARLTGSEYTHTAGGLRAIFRTLKAHQITPRDPAVHLRVGTPTATIPLLADLTLIREDLTGPDPVRAAITALLAFHAVRSGEIRHLTLADAADLEAGRLYLPDRTILLAEPARIRLAAYLAHRAARWPRTANPHLFLTSRSATSTTPVSRPYLYRQHPLSSQLIRSDRIVHEAQAAGADVRLICELFGLGIEAATRYTIHSPRLCSGPTPPS